MEEELSLLLRHSVFYRPHVAQSNRRVDARPSCVSTNAFWKLLTLFVELDRPFDSGSHSDHTVQKLLLGTHTSNDEQNYLQIVSVSALEISRFSNIKLFL